MSRRTFTFVLILLFSACSNNSINSPSSSTLGDPFSPGNGSDPGDLPEPTAEEEDTSAFTRRSILTSVNSAVVYWQINGIDRAALSYVEWGDTNSYGNTTSVSQGERWGQWHRITGLQPDQTYHYRMVMQEGTTRTYSEDGTVTTGNLTGAIILPGTLSGPPYDLTESGRTYILDEDITAPQTAILISGASITLDLNGHIVMFGMQSGDAAHGIRISGGGTISVGNGHVVQGEGGGDYGVAVGSRWRSLGAEIYGISTYVHGSNAHPIRLFGSATDSDIHHNHLYSEVREIFSRHYPGNDLLRVDLSGPNVSVHDNILTEGAHRGINMGGEGANAEVSFNDIQHHARFVNGYALNAGAPGLNIHHNKVTSTGRGTHLTEPHIEFHDNHMDLKGHMTLSDMPSGSGIWLERMIELHGIKLEGDRVTNAQIYNNYVRITQYVPDQEWDYVPATPLNLAAYNPNGMNEIFGNTIVALTEYVTTYHGGYGDSGRWAASIYLVGMEHGPASPGQYAVYIHDNQFVSNDIYVGGRNTEDMTIRIENNTFSRPSAPLLTDAATQFWRISSSLEAAILSGNNSF